MTMQNEDRDWLDARIAVQNYIPDDGFTARVVDHLPRVQSDAMKVLRLRILVLSSIFAAGVATGLLITEIGPMMQGLNHLASVYSPTAALGRVAQLLQQPTVLLGGAAGIILLGFISIPFLRRWA